jgi:cyclophilin family peptidyl-prolyl cis-trans isomerase
MLIALGLALRLAVSAEDDPTWREDEVHDPRVGRARAVLETPLGELHVGFYEGLAPATAAHIMKLVRLGGYNTNHISRLEPGLVAQVQAVHLGRRALASRELRKAARKVVDTESTVGVRHERGMLSLARDDGPSEGTSSFSIMLGNAPVRSRAATGWWRVGWLQS